MSRFIVMDIVFYGSSLNYDQGTGNYQELKKITKWDGGQYTLVSRYALRYSILETAKTMNVWDIADAEKLHYEGDKKVIQPSTEILLSGEILNYPEFDLFGYLITSTTPQNFRTAPVKISHAVSMTPFNYDALFNANIGLANRMRKRYGEMSPNPFTAEEHVTFYQYTVVVDLDNIGKIDVYLAKTVKEGSKQYTMKSIEITKDNNDVNFKIEYSGSKSPIEFKYKNNNDFKINRIILPFNENDKNVKISEELRRLVKFDDSIGALILRYNLKKEMVEKRIKELVKTILNLKRSIKGRCEDLSPKLMIVGIYKNKPYKTYKDRIFLKDEYSEESYDEIEEREENGKKIVKVKHVVSKTKKPVFDVVIGNRNCEVKEISEDEVIKFIELLYYSDIVEEMKKDGKSYNEIINELKDQIKDENMLKKLIEWVNTGINEVQVFYDPSIEVKVK